MKVAQKIIGGVIGVLCLTAPVIAQSRAYQQTAVSEGQSICTSLIGDEIEYQKPCTLTFSQHISVEGDFYIRIMAESPDEMGFPITVWSSYSPNPQNCPQNPRAYNTFATGGIGRCLVESPRYEDDLTREIPASELESLTPEERDSLPTCFKTQNFNRTFCY